MPTPADRRQLEHWRALTKSILDTAVLGDWERVAVLDKLRMEALHTDFTPDPAMHIVVDAETHAVVAEIARLDAELMQIVRAARSTTVERVGDIRRLRRASDGYQATSQLVAGS